MAKKNEGNSKPAASNGATPSAPTPAATKRAVKPAAAKTKAGVKAPKAVAAVKAKRTTKPKAPTTPVASTYSRDDVALRAYFIAEKRRAHGLPGDEHQDWIEAERQILAESAKPAKKLSKA